MKAQLGKPTGLALALLATLLATFLAMGVFSVAQANVHSATRTISPATVAPGGEVTVTIVLSAYGESGGVRDTLPEGFSFVSGSVEWVGGEVIALSRDNNVNFILDGAGVTRVSYKLIAPDAAGGPHTFSGTFKNSGGDSTAIIGDPTVTVVMPTTNGGNGDGTDPTDGNGDGNGEPEAGMITLTPGSTAGAAVQVVIKAWAHTAKTSANDITVNLAKFGVPTTIPERSIIIADDSATGHSTARYIGEPGSVTVSGTKVTLSLYARFPGSSNDTAGTLKDGYTITFKQSAGITNPPVAGTATVTVSDGDPTGHTLTQIIQSAVSLSKGSGARGTDVTVEGVGLGAGGATVYLVNGACADQGDLAEDVPCTEEDDISLGTGNVSSGKVEVDIETSSSDFEAGVDQIDKDGVKITRPAQLTAPPTACVVETRLLSWTAPARSPTSPPTSPLPPPSPLMKTPFSRAMN